MACWPVLWAGDAPRVWAAVVGGPLVVVALIRPLVLRPLYRVWMAVGQAMGWVNTRVVLTLLFYGVLVPIGWTARVLGRDALRLSPQSSRGSYRVHRTPRPVTHVHHQF
jgi:hypothetical protein